MLLPYDERIMSLSALPGEFLSTLRRDAHSDRLTGFVLAMGAQDGLGLVYLDGELVAGYRSDGEPALRRGGFHTPLGDADLPALLTIEWLRGDEGMVALAWRAVAKEPLWRQRFGSIPETLTDAAGTPAAGVLVRYRGFISELAYVEDGAVVFGYTFDTEAGGFKRCPAGFWLKAGAAELPCEFVVAGPLDYAAPAFESSVDPLDLLIQRYQHLLGGLSQALRDELGEGTDERLSRLLDSFKRKYPPLYRGVYMNPETGLINWGQLLSNREKVNRKYRYDKFLLYLDEAVLQLGGFLRESAGAEGVARFKAEWQRLQQADEDADRGALRLFYAKKSSFLRKLT